MANRYDDERFNDKNEEGDYRKADGFPDYFFRSRATAEAGQKNSPRATNDVHLAEKRNIQVREKAGKGVKTSKSEVAPKSAFRKNSIAMSAGASLGDAIPGLLEDYDGFVDLVAESVGYAYRVDSSRYFSDRDDELYDTSSLIAGMIGNLIDIEDNEFLDTIDEALAYQGKIYKEAMASGYVAGVRNGHTTSEMIKSIEEARGASPTPNKMIKNAQARVPLQSGSGVSAEAVLLHSWLTSEGMSGAVAAEAWARCEIYLRSGWAERDIKGPSDDMTPADREAVEILSEAAHKVMHNKNAGKELSPDEIRSIGNAIGRRLDTLCMPISIYENNGPAVMAYDESAKTRMTDIISGKTAGGRLVDIAMRGADGESFHVGTVTARNDLDSQGRQHVEHITAIIRAIHEGSDDRFKGVDPNKVHFTLHSSATIGHDDKSSNRRNLMTAFTKAALEDETGVMQKWDRISDTQMVSNIGLLKLFGLLAKGQSTSVSLGKGLEVPVAIILRTRLCQFGGMSTDFDVNQSTGDLAEEAARLVSDFAQQMGAASRYMPFQNKGSNNPIRTIAQIVSDLTSSIEGIGQHFGSPPGAFEDEEDPRVVESKKRVWNILEQSADALVEIAARALPQTGPGTMIENLLSCASYLSGNPYRLATTQVKGENISYISTPAANGRLLYDRCIKANQDNRDRIERAVAIEKAISSDGKDPFTKGTLNTILPKAHRMAYWMDDATTKKLVTCQRPWNLLMGTRFVDDKPIDMCANNAALSQFINEVSGPPSYQQIARSKKRIK